MRRLHIILFVAAAIAGCARENAHGPAATNTETTSAAAPATPAAGGEVGTAMPAYTAKGLGGKPFDLASLEGDVVFLNVWATWCGPCRFEIPELQAMHDKYSSKGFKVVGVSVDETGIDAVKQFVSDKKMTYPVVIDPEGRIANILSTTVLPTSVIIDRKGRIVWRKLGAIMPNEVKDVDSVVEKTIGR